VVSGYLITSMSIRRFGSLATISAPRFYLFRFARIIPCLVLILTIITTLGLLGIRHFASTGPTSFFIADLSVLTFWHNVLMAKVGYFNYGLNILWSLSVEEVFYLTFPLLCLSLRRTRWIVPVWIAIIIFGPIYRSWHTDDEIRFLYGYFACFDAIAMGCCVAVLARWLKERQVTLGSSARTCIQLAAGAFITWIYLRQAIGDSPVLGPSLVALGAALFVFAEAIWKPGVNSLRAQEPGANSPYARKPGLNSSRARWEPIGWLGQRSYELYLFHIVVLALMRNIVERTHLQPALKPLWFLVFLVSSTAVAYAIARFYSEPLNQRIRNLAKSSAPSAPPQR